MLADEADEANGEPSVSLESFIWAHCLVRSRALDLSIGRVADADTSQTYKLKIAALSLSLHEYVPGSQSL